MGGDGMGWRVIFVSGWVDMVMSMEDCAASLSDGDGCEIEHSDGNNVIL